LVAIIENTSDPQKARDASQNIQTVVSNWQGAGGTGGTMAAATHAAIYARVSTVDQEPENQLQELRRYAEARGWIGIEFVDRGISGAKDRRPALDQLLNAVRRRKVNVVIVWSLDRLGRSLRHLIALLDEFQHVGVGFISLREGLDCTTPARRLQWQIIGCGAVAVHASHLAL
jgi:DNA invertase Pin-like site-specific DNA recombinase